MLIWDLRSASSVANPKNHLKNPLELFASGNYTFFF